MGSNLNIDQEYIQVLRTKSYRNILSKAQDQLGRRGLERLAPSSSSFSLSLHLLEPHQETLLQLLQLSNPHHLLINYFKATFEAGRACELLLQSIHKARANHHIITRVVKLTAKKPTNHKVIFDLLNSFAALKNPFLIIKPHQFKVIHDKHGYLFNRLTKKCKNVRRRAKLTRWCKKMAGLGLVASYSAVLVALLVLALHVVVGAAAAPALIACTVGLVKRRGNMVKGWLKTAFLERLGTQLEVASKGVFVLVNDFDTMGQLVERLQDEIEHTRTIAAMCVRNGKNEIMMEVVQELQNSHSCFLEQLEELEEKIYLCFLDINRSRTLVLQEITVDARTCGTSKRE
ncbi:hypothetical protein NMG60_11016089 [Bertholletia excelsa]